MSEPFLTDDLRINLTRAIAESDITDGQLENKDIDNFVDLFEAWLEREMIIIPEVLWERLVRAICEAETKLPAAKHNKDLNDLLATCSRNLFELDPATVRKVRGF
jgi:hypothetical protein